MGQLPINAVIAEVRTSLNISDFLSTRKTSGESDLGRPVSVVAESRMRVSTRHSPFYEGVQACNLTILVSRFRPKN
jgi:hypothetical protein